MKLFLRHFYNISVAIGIIIIIGTIIIWQDINALQRLALLNLAVINFHFLKNLAILAASLNLQIPFLLIKIARDQTDSRLIKCQPF